MKNIYVSVAAILLCVFSLVTASTHETKLMNYLLQTRGYNPLIRPVRNDTDVVTVKFEMALIQIINVEEKSQYMTTNVWLRMSWNDYQLQWNPSDYGGISLIRVPAKKLWLPDIVLFNNADGNYDLAWQPNILVQSNGDILWIPPAIYKSSCTILVRDFPFDEQRCEMHFGSWTYDASQVILDWFSNRQFVDLSDYWKSGTWDIIDCYGKIVRSTKADGIEGINVVYTITLRRKTLYYMVNLIIPCVMIALLSVCLFYLPTDSCEKIQVCVCLQLALVVFLLLISKILPNTSLAIPLISRYLIFTFLLNIIIFFVTLIVVRFHYNTPNTQRMSPWIRVIFMEWLPPLLLMRRQRHVQEYLSKQNRVKRKRKATKTLPVYDGTVEKFLFPVDDMEMTQRVPTRQLDEQEEIAGDLIRCRSPLSIQSASGVHEPITRKPEFPADVLQSAAAIEYILAQMKSDNEFESVKEDWKYVASVMDRLLLFIFIGVTLFGSVGIFLEAPKYGATPSQDDIIKQFS